MAREESHREDLMREATALVERVAWQAPGDSGEPIVVGFRRDGSGSLFVGQEVVLQFNRRNELRRAYWQGSLFKAERGGLVRLRRERTAQAVFLQSQPLTAGEVTEFLAMARRMVDDVRAALADDRLHVLAQVPADAGVAKRAHGWLEQLAGDWPIADAPGVHGAG